MAKKEVEEMMEEWARNYIDGLSWFIARSIGETPEETYQEYLTVKRVFEEKMPEIKEKAKKWRRRILEVLGA